MPQCRWRSRAPELLNGSTTLDSAAATRGLCNGAGRLGRQTTKRFAAGSTLYSRLTIWLGRTMLAGSGVNVSERNHRP
jgi:hypothetical protein